MHREDELVWVLQFAMHCTRGHGSAQVLPVGSTSLSHARGTGAELVGNAGMEKTSPAGKATRGEGVCAGRISERCLEGRWAGSKGWHGGSRACKEAKTQCKYLPAALPAPGTRVPRSRPCSSPAGPARSGTGDH